MLTVAGGPVVVQWSLSYTAGVRTALLASGPGGSVAHIQVLAALERDGIELARWTLADQSQDLSLPAAQGWATGSASGLFVDQGVGVRHQDLRSEGVEHGCGNQRQHAHPDLRGALIACRRPPPVRCWSAHVPRAI
jgi:hypothetical protein